MQFQASLLAVNNRVDFSAQKKGRIVAMFDFLELRWIFSLKAVSDLNWKKSCLTKNEKGFWPANCVFVHLRQFLV